jgi:hypothetical protein
MRSVVRVFLFLLAGIGATGVFPATARAVPAFARAYHVPCTTCHVQFPKLNEFGMAFKQNGYRMPGETGRFAWTRDDLPLAGQTLLDFEGVDAKGNASRTVDRRTLEFFSAGTMGPTLAYFLDYAFTSDTATDSNGDTVDVTTAAPGGTFLVLSDLVPDNRLNLRLGVMSDEFLYLGAARRTTLTDYLAPVSPDHTGIEVNGVFKASGVRYAVGFGDDEMVGVAGVKNNLRAGYGWATYTIHGQSLGARVIAAQAGASTASDGTHLQVDGNLDLHHGPANLIVAYYDQDNVAGVRDDKQINALAELVYAAGHHMLVTGRYESQDTETSGAAVPGTDREYVFSTSYYLLANVNLMAEFERADRGESGASGNKYIVGVKVGL